MWAWWKYLEISLRRPVLSNVVVQEPIECAFMGLDVILQIAAITETAEASLEKGQ